MSGIDELLRIMARLRDPVSGCPWDLEQDFASISPHTIEEAYEVDEAIARGDLESLCDELGDLLFQVVFQARLAQEAGAFDFAAVVESIRAKLVRRHPHIFAGAPSPGSAAAQVANWEAIKATERAARRERVDRFDPFEGIPRALPSLMRSAKLRGRMDRSMPDGAGAAVRSEAAVRAALLAVVESASAAERAVGKASRVQAERASGPDHAIALGDPEREAKAALVGAGIRAWVELARQLGVDPELALRREDDRAVARVLAQDAHQDGSEDHR